MNRINLKMTMQDIIVKIAEGNPGAVMAMMNILKKSNSIDPDNVLGALGIFWIFDDMKIYGTDIYVLYSDKCDKDTRKLLMLLRAVQLGFFPRETLVKIAKDQSKTINLKAEEFEKLDEKVCAFLPNFAKPIMETT